MTSEWDERRRAVADLWFDGDVDRADRVLDALPYSRIPDWGDVDALMGAITSVDQPEGHASTE